MMTKTVYRFYADWCGPCTSFNRVVQAVFQKHPEIEVRDVNVDDAPIEAFNHQITSVPALVFLLDDIPIKTLRGVVSEAALHDEVNLVFGEGT